jgi:error-prone DNA polymerase
MAVTVTATECWDLPALEEIRLRDGIAAVRAAMEAGDVVPGGAPASESGDGEQGTVTGGGTSRAVVFGNGFAMSRYAETGAPGAPLKAPPRAVWHASPGSSGTGADMPDEE